jgi:hypothetical protein
MTQENKVTLVALVIGAGCLPNPVEFSTVLSDDIREE